MTPGNTYMHHIVNIKMKYNNVNIALIELADK